ncbi:cystatin-SN-like [Aquarana catesbeiana]|uniref:cystatin-SN-like n=1 Tax=Aquarana catesbeiana TaxID=8400 RepID=UPI003CC944FB
MARGQRRCILGGDQVLYTLLCRRVVVIVETIMAGLGALIIFLLWAPVSLSEVIGGGWRPADKNSKVVQDIADFCVSEFNRKSYDYHLFKMISFEDAYQQVVSEMNYKLTIVLAQTNCMKNRNNPPNCKKSSSKCHINKCVCLVFADNKLWRNRRTLKSLQCTAL